MVSTTNYGYHLLLAQLDALVLNSYGNLAESPDYELQSAGQQVIDSYFTYR